METMEAPARGPAFELRNFLDHDGRLRTWPAKRRLQLAALQLLAGKFVDDLLYTEKEVNGLLNLHHAFGDVALLRFATRSRGARGGLGRGSG